MGKTIILSVFVILYSTISFSKEPDLPKKNEAFKTKHRRSIWEGGYVAISIGYSNIDKEKAFIYGGKTEFPSINFDSGEQIGLIAQEVEKVYPELVKTDENGYKAVSYEKLSVVLVEGMKEQQQIIEKQQVEIDHLKSLETEVLELKTLVNTLIANQTGRGNK